MAQTKTKKPAGPALIIEGKPVMKADYPPRSGWRLIGKEEARFRAQNHACAVEAIRVDEHGVWEAWSRDNNDRYRPGRWTIRWEPSVDLDREDDESCGLPVCGNEMFDAGTTYADVQATAAIVDSWLAAGLSQEHAVLLCGHTPSWGGTPDTPPYYRSHGRMFAEASDAFRALNLRPLPFWADEEQGPVESYARDTAWDQLFFRARFHAFLTDEEQESGVGPVWDALNTRDPAALEAVIEERRPLFEAEAARQEAEEAAMVAEREEAERLADERDDVCCVHCQKVFPSAEAFDATADFCSEECMTAFEQEQARFDRVEEERLDEQELDDQDEPEAPARAPVQEPIRVKDAPAPTPKPKKPVTPQLPPPAPVSKAAVQASQLSLF